MDLTYPWERRPPGCQNGSSGYYAAHRALDERFPEASLGAPATEAEARAYRREMRRIGWQFHRCAECGTRTLPLNFRRFDPDWWWFKTLFWPLWRLRMRLADRARRVP
ncbi:hypothetical protein ACXR2T_07900 [Leucobacter sp. HY1910]